MKNLINKVTEKRKIGLKVGAISLLLVMLSIWRRKRKNDDNLDIENNLIMAVNALFKQVIELREEISVKLDEIRLDTKLNNEEIISNLEHIDSLSKIIDEMKESE